jgi:hypothetical protein
MIFRRLGQVTTLVQTTLSSSALIGAYLPTSCLGPQAALVFVCHASVVTRLMSGASLAIVLWPYLLLFWETSWP